MCAHGAAQAGHHPHPPPPSGGALTRLRAGQAAGAPLHCPPRTHPATSPVRRRTPLHMKAVAWDGAGGEAAALSYSVCGTPAPTVPPVLLDGRATPLVDHGSGVASAHLRGPFRGDQGGAALGQCPDGVWQFTPYFKKGVDKARDTHTEIREIRIRPRLRHCTCCPCDALRQPRSPVWLNVLVSPGVASA